VDYITDLSVPEGPVVLPDGAWLVVEMGPDRGCVTKIDGENGASRRVLARTGRPNGLAVDAEQTIWVAESEPASLLRMSMDGSHEAVATHCGDDPFLFPNDLCFGPDGMLYLTDSGIRFAHFAPGGNIRSDYNSAPVDGRLYRIDPSSLAVEELTRGIRFANGLAFGLRAEHLYVAETLTGDILRYRWSPTALGPPEVFANVVSLGGPAGLKGPDGIAFGANGDLYVAVFGQGEVTVLAPDGSVKQRIRTRGSAPANVAFGGPGERRIYVTEDERGTLERFDADTEGLALHV